MAYIKEEVKTRMKRPNRTQNGFAGSRILVVDDNHKIMVSVSLMLEALGFEVDTANCGAAALNCLNRFSYDAVLTDFEMPGMMGDALAAKIRKKWPGTGVVVMTGMSHDEMEDCGENGAAGNWIFKPFNINDLGTTMNKVFRSDYN